MAAVLKSNLLKGTAFARQAWLAIVPNDTTVEEVLKPGYWVHYAPTLKPYAVIEVISEDCLLDMDVRVTRIAEGLVYVRPIRIVEDTEGRAAIISAKTAEATDDTPLPPIPDGYKVGFAPGNQLYYVKLNATGATVKPGIKTRREAVEYAIEHAKKAGVLAAA